MNKDPELDSQETKVNVDEGDKVTSSSSGGLGRKKERGLGGDRTPKNSSQNLEEIPKISTPPDNKANEEKVETSPIQNTSQNTSKAQNAPRKVQVNKQNKSNSSFTSPKKPKRPQSMIWVLPFVLLVVSVIGGGIYLSQNQQQPIKPTPTDSPSGTSDIPIPQLSTGELNRLNKSELESRYTKVEEALKKLQELKKNSNNDRQRVGEIDRAIAAYEKQKTDINRAIANLNAASTEDKDKLQKIKNSVLAYDSIEKLKGLDCSQQPQVNTAIDGAIANLKQLIPNSLVSAEAEQLTNIYTKLKGDFPNQCKKARSPQPQPIPTNQPTQNEPINTSPEGIEQVQPSQPSQPDVTVTQPERPVSPPPPQTDIVPDLPSDIDVQKSGKITPKN